MYPHVVFTGIIQQQGRVIDVRVADAGARMVIDPLGWPHAASAGDSIAVNGCCLTVLGGGVPHGQPVRGELEFDVVSQTLRLTTLGAFKPGDSVNLEHAATPTTLLGGHIVQGHVDGVATVVAMQNDVADRRVRFSFDAGLNKFVIPQGSIAVDGVSLTVAAAGDDWFEVALIPTTRRLTTLGGLTPGARTNIEADYLAKLIIARMDAIGSLSLQGRGSVGG